MSESTNIEWATSTGNPWIGCTKVSPGCKNCYAVELDANRFSRTMGGGTKENPVSHWGKGAPRFKTKGFWKDAVKWNHAAKKPVGCDCVSLSGKMHRTDCKLANHRRPRIFPSLCDWLDEEVPIEWLADFLKLINDTPNLDWLNLTKRPELFFHRLRLVAELLAKEVSTGYPGSHEITSSTRESGVCGDSERGVGSGQRGANMAREKAHIRPMDGGHENDPMQTSQGGVGNRGGLPASKADARRNKSGGGGAQVGLALFQGEDTAGHDNKSQERIGRQVGQQDFKSGTGDLQRTKAPRDKSIKGEASRCARTESPKDKTDQCGRFTDAPASTVRDDGKNDCGTIWNEGEGRKLHYNRKDLVAFANWLMDWMEGRPPPNVWIGISVEDQKRADERIPLLLQIPAKVRFLSVEPLLSMVNLKDHLLPTLQNVQAIYAGKDQSSYPNVHWVIVGGESGKDRRDCGVEAICDVARQCVAADVPCFVKQDSAFRPGQKGRIPDDVWALKEFPKT